MNVIHGKMIIYNTAFKNSNLCAPNGVRLSGYYNIDLIVDIVLFKSINILWSEIMVYFLSKD